MEEAISLHHYKSGIEALLFVSDKPIAVDQFKTVFPELKPAQIADLVKEVQDEYVARNGGIVIVEIAGGWQMLSNSHAAGYIREFYKTHTKEKLSKPALETLAIVAYKQPVGRADVEVIRGVNSDGTMAHLLNKGLIEIVGRKEVPGRPFLYGTTKSFLDYFGLRSLDGLPKIEELANINLEALASTVQVEQKDQAVEPPQGTVQEGNVEEVMTVSGEAAALTEEEIQTQETSGQSRLDNGITTTAQ